MPYYSELGLTSTSGGSAYSSLLFSSPYSNHSSIIASNFQPYSTSVSRQFRGGGFKPHLSTISELNSPLKRINTPNYHTPIRPLIKTINTADIDVSRNRYRKFEKYERPKTESKERVTDKKSSPTPKSPVAESPRESVEEREAKPNTKIRRDRTTVRLQTIHKDTLEKEIGVIKSWRDNFKPDELGDGEAKRRKKTQGEILKEKFLIRSKSKENVLKPEVNVRKKQSVRKSPSFHDICKAITSDSLDEELNPGQPEEIKRRQSRQFSTESIINEIRRSSSQLCEEDIHILDALLHQQEEMNDAEVPEKSTDNVKKKKVSRKKTGEIPQIVKSQSKEKISDGESKSPIQRRRTQKKVKRTISNGSDNAELDNLVKDIYINTIRDISNVNIEQTKFKPKPIITASVDDIEEVKPVLKAIVDDVKVEESPKKTDKKFKFNVIVEVENENENAIKKKLTPKIKVPKTLRDSQKRKVLVSKAEEIVTNKVLVKKDMAQVGQVLETKEKPVKKQRANKDVVEVCKEEVKSIETIKSAENNRSESSESINAVVNNLKVEDKDKNEKQKSTETKSIELNRNQSLQEEVKIKESPPQTPKTILSNKSLKSKEENLSAPNLMKSKFEVKTVSKENNSSAPDLSKPVVSLPTKMQNRISCETVFDGKKDKKGDIKQTTNNLDKTVSTKPEDLNNFESSIQRTPQLLSNANNANKNSADDIKNAVVEVANQKAAEEKVTKQKSLDLSQSEVKKPQVKKQNSEGSKQSKQKEIKTTPVNDIYDKIITSPIPKSPEEEKKLESAKIAEIEDNPANINSNSKIGEKPVNLQEKINSENSPPTIGEKPAVVKIKPAVLEKSNISVVPLKDSSPAKDSEIKKKSSTEKSKITTVPLKDEPEPEKKKKLISKRSLVRVANKDDPDLEVFVPPEPPEPEPEPEPEKEVFVPLQSNRLSNWMHPWKKPEQLEVCPIEIYARPKVIRGRHYPRPRAQKNGPPAQPPPKEESSSEEEEDDDSDEETSSSEEETSSEEEECDSGFGSKDKGSSESRDSPITNHANNPAFAPDSGDIPEEYSQSSTFTGFQRSGRITPPATTIPRFRKYCLDDFNFLKVLGKGSFGKVLLAELKGTDYYYAVKCLKKDVVLEDDDVECTLIERKVLALGTKHPYLCHLLCTFQTESHLFFVMEYLNGGDLMFHIQASGRFPEHQARFYGAEIVSGLKFLHNKGIVYRDLKLDNVLLDFDGHVRIADFGMCKLQIFLDRMAETFCGTPDYMAPEIIKGQHYNQNVDWWSFGVLLYEMLLGQSPFSGCDEDELFWSICNEKPVLPRYLSPEANNILTLLLEKDASKRLGNRFCPHGDIQDHAFFKPIDWPALEARQLEAPFKPNLQHPLDTQYFDKHFTVEKAKLTPVESTILQSIDQTQFQGFSYTNPNATDK